MKRNRFKAIDSNDTNRRSIFVLFFAMLCGGNEEGKNDSLVHDLCVYETVVYILCSRNEEIILRRTFYTIN